MEKRGLLSVRSVKRKIVENLVCLRVPFKDIEAEIEIEKTGKAKARIRVILPEAKKTEKPVRITLKKKEREIASYLLDWDFILFENIPFGHYSISLIEDDVKVGEYFFEIKENHHGKK